MKRDRVIAHIRERYGVNKPPASDTTAVTKSKTKSKRAHTPRTTIKENDYRVRRVVADVNLVRNKREVDIGEASKIIGSSHSHLYAHIHRNPGTHPFTKGKRSQGIQHTMWLTSVPKLLKWLGSNRTASMEVGFQFPEVYHTASRLV
ncbi:MAG: hypothetical protein CMB80_05475 [Flammeovirgaceae bacterium]|nr:hypothetical protein [Flammeovirgaceae bacterium]|tara:strand:+ start:3464 stop:3904 length:441 start_codon:yes stop_codon:yes gene_type:complete